MSDATEAHYVVAGMTCQHCVHAVQSELAAVPGVADVQVDLDTKQVVVQGTSLDDAVLRAAITEAGYAAA